MAEMMARTAQPGRVDWIGVRPERRKDLLTPDRIELTEAGLDGDHASGGKRAVTLIQAEHLAVISALLSKDAIDPTHLRRNIVVSGLNLLGFRKATVRAGSGILRISGPCPPCSRMEEALGFGGYTAMRGHGGVYAEVVRPGEIAVGDAVVPHPI